MHTIGLDIGSSNVKAVLVDEGGLAVASASEPLRWEQQGETALQDAVDLWGAVVRAVRAVGAAGGSAAMADVGAVGLCGQYSSIVPVDESLVPVAPMRLYLDKRGSGHCLAILGRHEDAFTTWVERHPIPPVGGGLALGHLLGFQLDEPEVHARTHVYLEPVDYVSARLTGTATATQVSMFADQLIDNRTLGVTEYDAELIELAGVDPTRLPALVPSGSVVGSVRADVAEATGLPGSAVVVAGMTDSHAAALATGASEPGRVGIAIGTTAVVLTATAGLGVDLDHEVLAMPGVRPDEYLVWAENGLAGRAVEHVLGRFVHASDALGDHGAADLFDGFEAALAASDPGAGGVRFLPWLSGSLAPSANPSVRGGFVGLSLDTERVDLVRAAAEGVAHNLRWLLGPVEAFAGETATEVVLTGGAARSPGWSQIVADVLGLPVRTVGDPGHAGARAVAAWARSCVDDGSGPAPSPVDGPAPGSTWGPRYEPDAATAEVHRAAQAEFTAAHPAFANLAFASLTP